MILDMIVLIACYRVSPFWVAVTLAAMAIAGYVTGGFHG